MISCASEDNAKHPGLGYKSDLAKEVALFERIHGKLRAEDRAAMQHRKARREGGC
jgi:hypothetical protein